MDSMPILFWVGMALGAAVCAYQLCALFCVARFARRPLPATGHRPPVTVLKPVSGMDFRLYDHLRSFCEQDYPDYQVIFGVRSADDPAVPEIRRLIAALPGRDLDLVIDPASHGANRKVSNLCNMMARARHDILVIADSDMRVRPDYLAAVAQPFADPGVGAVTCLYRGVPAGGALSRLTSLWISEWFLPSVLVAELLEEVRYCFGATMAVRREILDGAGGFASLADYLADDYMIGQYTAASGHRVEISRYLVDATVCEASLRDMFAHELRWARTMRAMRPGGYRFSFLINAISVGLLAGFAAAAAVPWAGVGLVGAVIGLRLALHRRVTALLGGADSASVWMIPVRDLLSLVIWFAAYLGREVSWRGQRYAIIGGGRLVAVPSLEKS